MSLWSADLLILLMSNKLLVGDVVEVVHVVAVAAAHGNTFVRLNYSPLLAEELDLLAVLADTTAGCI